MIQRRSLALVLALAATLTGLAAAAGAQEAPKNLKVFPEDTGRQELVEVMKGWTQALGVRCDFCHVQKVPGDFDSFEWDSDEKEHKLIARRMLRMVMGLNAETLPRATGEDDAAVSCITCHRGLTNPATIDRVMLKTVDKDGADAAVARYRELRERYYGSGSYDFGPLALLPAIEALADRDGGLDAALKLAALCVELNPADPNSRLVQAQLLMQKGDADGAAAAVEKALELDPDNRHARRLRGRLGR